MPIFKVFKNKIINIGDMMLAFLDMDGVLNSRNHFDFRGTDAGINRRKRLQEEHEGLTAIALMMLDESKVELLQKFTIETGCKFVISSTWREGKTPEYFEKLFKLSGFEFPENSVIGCTPILDHIDNQKRGHEINSWIIDNKYTGKYVVIDDDCPSIFLEDQPLVNTDYIVGLTDDDIVKVKELLL
jgi:hypothetical protein